MPLKCNVIFDKHHDQGGKTASGVKRLHRDSDEPVPQNQATSSMQDSLSVGTSHDKAANQSESVSQSIDERDDEDCN